MKTRHLGERWPRRGFLKSVGASVASLSAVGCGEDGEAPLGPPPPEAGEYRDAIERYFEGDDELENAAVIGEYTVRAKGYDTSRAFDSTRRTRDLIDAEASSSDAVASLEERLHDDFVDARIVSVDGWTLSRTEVDLCVLAYMVLNLDD